MNKYIVSNMFLTKVDYNFDSPDAKQILLSINDEIKIDRIIEKKAVLVVSRKLDFGKDNDTYVKITYDVVMDGEDNIDKEELVSALKENNAILAKVFSKISLLISEITDSTPFGTLITQPRNDSKSTIIG